ncbi:unnamed protein product, partial [Mesorhabditis belari]|uniref:Uncharacterized protein n=1 Tax=Mesorhabditis belari TaxID=2138241 RepID=A0AAF3FMZ9_9BILA
MNASADDAPEDESGLDDVCNNIESLGEKYNMSATNIKSVLKCLYTPEIITKVLSHDTQGIPTLKITRSKAGPSRLKADESCTQISRAQRTFLNVNYEEEDAFDGDYEPESDPTLHEVDVADESSSESETSSTSGSETALELELERELELLKEPFYPLVVEASTSRQPDPIAIVEPYDSNSDMQLNLDDMLNEEISERVPWKYSTRSKANLNLTATSDALEEEKRELFACSNQEVYSNVDPEYLGFCQSINTAAMPLPDDEEEDEEFVPATCEFEEVEKEPEEIRRDRATEITKRETTALLTDLTVEETELFLTGLAPTEELINQINSKRQRRTKSKPRQSTEIIVAKEPDLQFVDDSNSARLLGNGPKKFRDCEVAQLKTQLEQHVQLLTQMVVACNFDDTLAGFRGRFLAMINELDILFYEHNPNGMFNIKNMPAAISTCHEATNTTKINNWDPNMHIFLRPTPEMPTHARSFASSRSMGAFENFRSDFYPELVPECAMNAIPTSTSYSSFTHSENLLLILGLIQFGHIEKHRARASNRGQKKLLISKHLLPTKNPQQIEYHLRRKCKDKSTDPLSQMIMQANNGTLKLDWNFKQPLRIVGPMDSWPSALKPFWLKSKPRMESPIPTTPIHSLSPELDFCATPMVNSPRSMSPSRDIPLTPRREDCSRMWSPSMRSNQAVPALIGNPGRTLFTSTKENRQNKSKALSTSMLCPDNSNSNDVENIEESEDRSIVSLMKRKTARAQRNRGDDGDTSKRPINIQGGHFLICKIKADIDLRLSLHDDIRNRLYALILDSAPSIEMWQKMVTVLLPLHEHVLCLLSFLLPVHTIPSDYLRQPLRCSYENAFELLLTIEKYSPPGKIRFNHKQVLKQLLEICVEVNYDEKELWNRLEIVFSNQPALLKQLKRKCPWTITDHSIEAQMFEFLDLTASTSQGNISSSQSQNFEVIEDLLPNKSFHKKGTSCCVTSNGRLQVYTSTGQYVNAQPSYDKKEEQSKNVKKRATKQPLSWSIEDDTYLVNSYNEMEDALENIAMYASQELAISKELVEERLKFLISVQEGMEMSHSSEDREQPGERRVAQGGQPNEDDLESKVLNIQYKRFYVDAKQNKRGRFIKIAEMGNNHKSRIILTMSAAVSLAEKIEILKAFSDETPDKEAEKDVELKSETLNYETRRYYLDLKQNSRGRFLRIAQTNAATSYNARMSRSQVVIPGEGIGELLATLRELIEKYSEGYLDEHISPANLPEAKQFRGEGGKMFYFDSGSNDRGSFLRISEVKQASGFRTSITVPLNSLTKFRDTLSEIIDGFEKVPTEKVDGTAE